MKRWDYIKKGEQFMFEGPPSPSDVYVLIDDNKTLGGLFAHPEGGWLLLKNPQFFGNHPTKPRYAKYERIPETLTLLEAKDYSEKVLCARS